MSAERPLLIVDGDSFAHRYYHALPKSIRRADGGGGNLLDGVGGLLIRLWEEESPRAVLAAWDTLTVPTYRHTALPAYQSGRQFDRELLDQLDLAPQLVEAMGFAPAKADGYEADDFLAAGRGVRGGPRRHGDRRERRPRHVPARRRADDRAAAAEGRRAAGAGSGLQRCASATASSPRRCRTSSRCAATRRTRSRALAESARRRPPRVLAQYGSLEAALEQGRFAAEADALRLYRHIATMDREAPLPQLDDQQPTWERAAALAEEWGLGRLAGRLEALSSS